MRSQWCREHIDEAALNCGLGKDTVSDVKKAAAFCVDHQDMSDCSTRSLMALIDIRDDPVREKAISSISKSLESGKHPLTGQILKDKRLTEREIKKVIEKAELEVRGELSKKYAENRKNKSVMAPIAPVSLPPSLPDDAPMTEKIKRDNLLLEIHGAAKPVQSNFDIVQQDAAVKFYNTCLTLDQQRKVTWKAGATVLESLLYAINHFEKEQDTFVVTETPGTVKTIGQYAARAKLSNKKPEAQDKQEKSPADFKKFVRNEARRKKRKEVPIPTGKHQAGGH
jgi:hypothetical protein